MTENYFNADKGLNMRKIIVILSCLVAGMSLQAQVQIQTTLPTTGLVQKNQLWNLVLLNNSNSNLEGRLEMVLLDRQTSQELITATTGVFILSRGSQAVNVNKLNPVQYNYIGMEPDQHINNLLAVGAYTACYSFVRNPNSDKRELLAEECVAFDVEPLSPPVLSFPADSSILETPPTQFSWMPPTPAALLSRVHYEVLITEVQPSQQPAEALEENTPFFSNAITPDNFMTYPAALPAFEKDKWYAWQVVARDDKNYAGKSEVWVFKVASANAVETILNSTPYIQLKKEGSDKTVAPNGNLRFYYFNQLADSAVTVSVTDLSEKSDNDGYVFKQSLVRGKNYLQKDLSRVIRIQEGHIYKLMLQNSAGEKWYIMFETKKY
jgi:hypothetical protein